MFLKENFSPIHCPWVTFEYIFLKDHQGLNCGLFENIARAFKLFHLFVTLIRLYSRGYHNYYWTFSSTRDTHIETNENNNHWRRKKNDVNMNTTVCTAYLYHNEEKQLFQWHTALAYVRAFMWVPNIGIVRMSLSRFQFRLCPILIYPQSILSCNEQPAHQIT